MYRPLRVVSTEVKYRLVPNAECEARLSAERKQRWLRSIGHWWWGGEEEWRLEFLRGLDRGLLLSALTSQPIRPDDPTTTEPGELAGERAIGTAAVEPPPRSPG